MVRIWSGEMEKIDWDKAPEGATHYRPGCHRYIPHWVKVEGEYRYMSRLERPDAFIHDHTPRPLSECIPRPSPAWGGEGSCRADHELKRLADKYLSYLPDTGVLIWKDNQQKRFIGREAGFITHHGYRRVSLGKTQIHAHQLIWLMVNGFLPDCEIDHINGCGDDNRIENLRLATTQQNQQNASVRVDNVLGIKGVRLRPSGRYQARVSLTDGSRLTKTFGTQAEAVFWLAKQREDSHGDFANTPEQIAADEREAAIKDLISITSDGVTSINMCDAARIYDAGYRKQDAN